MPFDSFLRLLIITGTGEYRYRMTYASCNSLSMVSSYGRLSKSIVNLIVSYVMVSWNVVDDAACIADLRLSISMDTIDCLLLPWPTFTYRTMI